MCNGFRLRAPIYCRISGLCVAFLPDAPKADVFSVLVIGLLFGILVMLAVIADRLPRS
jgi:hypothetical protein